MQQRGPNTTMESDNEGKTNALSSRGRHNSKLKFLVRSHAMREETSPPREPSPPSIQVIPTTETISSTSSSPLPTTNPIVVLSPSRNSPICVSPTSTLVPSSPSLSRCSSHQQQQQHCCSSPTNSLSDNDDIGNNEDIIDDETDPKYLNRIISNNNNKQMDKESSCSSGNNDNKKDNTSHIHNNINKKKTNCDCLNESCVKCTKNNNNSTNMNNNMVGSSNTLSVNRISNNKKIKQQSSSQTGSFEGSSSNSPCLSRDSSCEQQYTDTSGTNLEQFIPETLNRNAKDRAFMLRIEQELVSLAKDKVKTHFKFPPMSSYQRMLVHRCAAYFGMEHNIESSGKCVVVNKTKSTRIPDKEFREHIQDDIVFNEEPPRRSILKRDSNSMEDYTFKSPDRQFSNNGNNLENRRSKSFEEREEEYEKVRRRIFNRELLRQMHEGSSNDDFEWTEIPWSASDTDPSRFRLQLPEQNRRHTGKLIKVLSEETSETLRPYVAKSYSFGGYGTGLNRGDSVVSTHSAGPRLLTKQDSGASSVSWRLSPSSSGYKSQSQMSESVTPSPTSTPHLIGESSRQDSAISEDNNNNNSSNKNGQESIVWAVTDIQSVPKGSIIINPQTGEPIKNDDGSLYHYDPNNPPPGITTALKPPPSPKKKTNSPQRANSSNNNNNTNNTNSNNISGNNERSQSPNNISNINNNKKRFSKYSPSRKSHVTNSSTSPSLPYSPPLPIVQQQQPQQQPQQQQQRSFQYVENLPPQYPVYSPTVQSGPVPDNGGVAVYQQPCIVYTTPYGVPVSPHFDGRMEATIPDIGTTYYMSIPENSTTYQQPQQQQQQPSTYWNQQPISYYQTPQTNPTRFPLPVPPQGQTGYVAFPQNFLPQANQPTPQQQSTDLVPVFPPQQVQVVYSAQAPPPPPLPPSQQQQQTQSNTILYPNQPNIVYTSNPVYSTPIYPPQQYPQNTSTPNSCTSNFAGQLSEQQTNVMQITQNLAQMNFVSHQQISSNLGTNPNYNNSNHNNNNNNNRVVPSPYDVRQKSIYTSKNNGKFNNTTTKFVMNSSQSSSTGTNSPATTVLAGYCPQQNLYRTPPDTPPTQFGYGANYQIPPMLFRQMSNVRANTPGTNRSSRSPTPASDIQHFDKQRIPLTAPPPPPTAPTIYHGMPYVIQSNDNRIIPNRGQFNTYRQASFARHQQQQQQQQNSENRNYRNRKSK